MSEDHQHRKHIPFWLVILIGVVTTCVVTNAITIAFQLGAFKPWDSIQSPPSGAAKIIDASYREIWVETNNGQIFTTCIYGAESDECLKWKLVKNVSEVPEQTFPIHRGNDCTNLQKDTFPFNPMGRVIECVYANFPGPEMGEEAYFSLMADGSIKYWQNGGSLIATQLLFVLSTFVIPFFAAILISIIYLIGYVIKQKKANVSGQAAG